MAVRRDPLQETLKRKVAAAKAAKGYSWNDIAAVMTRCGSPITANNLMAKMSRGGIKATELVLIMRLLGHRFIDLSDVDIPSLDGAIRDIERVRQT